MSREWRESTEEKSDTVMTEVTFIHLQNEKGRLFSGPWKGSNSHLCHSKMHRIFNNRDTSELPSKQEINLFYSFNHESGWKGISSTSSFLPRKRDYLEEMDRCCFFNDIEKQIFFLFNKNTALLSEYEKYILSKHMNSPLKSPHTKKRKNTMG